jgi:hypothetical protein
VRIRTLAVAAAILAAGAPAVAAPCYVVYDRNDAVIYRDYKPPFDLSDSKSPERDMMRRQGQHLLVAEFADECNPVGFISATTGATTASVEEIVNEVRPAIPSNVANSGTTKAAARPGSKTPTQVARPKK